MMTSDDKVGGWVKKGQNHDDVILECPLRGMYLLTNKNNSTSLGCSNSEGSRGISKGFSTSFLSQKRSFQDF